MKNTWKIVASSLAMSMALAVGGAAHAEPPPVAIRSTVTVPIASRAAAVRIAARAAEVRVVPRAIAVPILARVAGPVRFQQDPRCRAEEILLHDGRCRSRTPAWYRISAQRPLQPVGHYRRAGTLHGWRW